MSSNNNQRINFASIKNQMDYPDFLEVQLKSLGLFSNGHGARKEKLVYIKFNENFPIADTHVIISY